MDDRTLRTPPEVSALGGLPSSGCCLSLDVQGTIVWAAQAVRELGWAPEELGGRNVAVMVPRLASLLGPAQRTRVLQAGAGQAGVTVVDVGVRRDGRLFEAAVDVAAKRSHSGEVSGLIVVVRDVTAELQQRRARRLSRARESVLVLGRDLAVRYATGPAVGLLGLRPADVFPALGEGLVHPDDRLRVNQAVERLVADSSRVERVEVRLRGGGRWRPVEATLSNGLEDPDMHGLVARLRELVDQRGAEDEARLSAALHRAMVEAADEGVVVTGGRSGTQYVNLATAKILGLAPEQLDGLDVPALLALKSTAAGREEVVYAHPDGFERILSVTRSPLGEESAGLGSLLTIADVTESRMSEWDLRRRALYDPLTGLPNRYLVQDRLQTAAGRQGRAESGSTAVLFIDLDGFKPVNDTHGHDAGDELLRQVAQRLVGAVRTTDTVGRVGGDEFVVVCEEVDDSVTSMVAARIQAALAEPVALEQGEVRVAASVGVALCPPFRFDQLLQEADAAMYRAKRSGGGGTVVAQP